MIGYRKQKKEINKLVNLKTLEHARKRTIEDKTFPTLKLFCELGEGYKFTCQAYIKLKGHRIQEIRYIYKMRIGCDGSREVLKES